MENLVRELVFLLSCEMSQRREREIILDIFHDVWKGQIFLCDSVLQRGIGEPLTSEMIQ